jgi:hypothetical protein
MNKDNKIGEGLIHLRWHLNAEKKAARQDSLLPKKKV